MAGCLVDYEVVDQITEGFGLLQMDPDITTGADIGVN